MGTIPTRRSLRRRFLPQRFSRTHPVCIAGLPQLPDDYQADYTTVCTMYTLSGNRALIRIGHQLGQQSEDCRTSSSTQRLLNLLDSWFVPVETVVDRA